MQIQILNEKRNNTFYTGNTKSDSKHKWHQKRTTHSGAVFLLVSLLISLLSITGCKYGLQEAFYRQNDVNDRCKIVKTITLPETVTNSPIYQSKEYNFMIITDLHYGANYAIPESHILNWLDKFDASRETKAQKPLFCLILGDIVENGNKEDYAAFNTFQSKLERKGIPVYCVVGNHDLLNSGWKYWESNCNPGTSLYCFKTETVSWYFTDTGSGTMGASQFAALEKAFKNDNNRKLVFSHYPLYGGGTGIPLLAIGDAKERAKIIDLYAKNKVKYVFEGHCHFNGDYDFGNYKEYICTTLKSGKWYLVSIDETTGNNADPVTAVIEIDASNY